jgi:phosphatidylglycerophosphate synthase
MPDTTRILPEPTRFTRSTLASGLFALGILAVVAWILQWRTGLGGPFTLKVLTAFALGLALLLVALPAQPPQSRFGAANQVTLGRAALAALLLGLIGEGSAPLLAWSAVAIGLLGITLDGLDGWLARRHGNASAFGARFDMETDAVLILALAVLAWQFGKAGPWILLAGLMRYAFVAAGFWLRWLRRPLPPSFRRQTVCVVQSVSLLLCIVPAVAPPWSAGIAGAGLILLSWSFWIDVRWLARHANRTTEEAIA